MLERYALAYTDENGTESSELFNDKSELRVTLHGVTFVGSQLDDFEVEGDSAAQDFSSFALNNTSLRTCSMEFAMPMQVLVESTSLAGAQLHVRLEMVSPATNGAIE
ncbi:MAG: hypothetical protein ACI841_001268 [Planctomycetota bacterium]|jgi:hypothetical protein